MLPSVYFSLFDKRTNTAKISPKPAEAIKPFKYKSEETFCNSESKAVNIIFLMLKT
jgi:hypothetical protein